MVPAGPPAQCRGFALFMVRADAHAPHAASGERNGAGRQRLDTRRLHQLGVPRCWTRQTGLQKLTGADLLFWAGEPGQEGPWQPHPETERLALLCACANVQSFCSRVCSGETGFFLGLTPAAGTGRRAAGAGNPGHMQGVERGNQAWRCSKGCPMGGEWVQGRACTAQSCQPLLRWAISATAGPTPPGRRHPGLLSQVHLIGHARGSVGLQLIVIRVVPSTVGRLAQLDHQLAESSAAAGQSSGRGG